MSASFDHAHNLHGAFLFNAHGKLVDWHLTDATASDTAFHDASLQALATVDQPPRLPGHWVQTRTNFAVAPETSWAHWEVRQFLNEDNNKSLTRCLVPVYTDLPPAARQQDRTLIITTVSQAGTVRVLNALLLTPDQANEQLEIAWHDAKVLTAPGHPVAWGRVQPLCQQRSFWYQRRNHPVGDRVVYNVIDFDGSRTN